MQVFLNILDQTNTSFFSDYNIISDGSFSHSTDVYPTNILVKLQILIFCCAYFDIWWEEYFISNILKPEEMVRVLKHTNHIKIMDMKIIRWQMYVCNNAIFINTCLNIKWNVEMLKMSNIYCKMYTLFFVYFIVFWTYIWRVLFYLLTFKPFNRIENTMSSTLFKISSKSSVV